MKKMIKISFIIALILNYSCTKENPEENQTSLKLTPENLVGEWRKIGAFKSTDSSGVDLSNENLMNSMDDCRKDDIYKYIVSNNSSNIIKWGYGNNICEDEGQEKNQFIEIGTWTLDERGSLNYNYSDVQEAYRILKLDREELLIRKKSGILENDTIKYYIEKYKRLN
jgi:hypothetical protein|tara:strand:- start:404 stop:907 length:504 start_codon:yes stop_codon:yes gene_type:complete